MLKNSKNTWLSWSSGKDSAFTLYMLSIEKHYCVTGLLTTLTEPYHRVSMHGVREELLDLQGKLLNLPITKVFIPSECSNEIYNAKMQEVLSCAIQKKVECYGFGDLFLKDIREYREKQLSKTHITPIFPLWGQDTTQLSKRLIQTKHKAIVSCIDEQKLPLSFLGREYNESFLAELPNNVDPCGENGEFHTFVYASPLMKESIAVKTGEIVKSGSFAFIDLLSV